MSLAPSIGSFATYATLVATFAGSAVPAGTSAFTGDLGMVVSDGTKWNVQSGSGSVMFYPLALTTAGISAAAALANSAGGGTVQLPPVTITLTGSLPMYNGVTYRGSGWSVTYPAGNNGLIPAVGAGTWLVGDGTFHGFTGNAVDGGAMAASATILNATCLTGAHIYDLAISNCLDGIHIGSKWNAGSQGSNYKNICVIGCQGWGVWFENCTANIYQLQTNTCVVGGQKYRSSTGTVWSPGNSIAEEIVNNASSTLTSRGISIDSINGTAGGLQSVGTLESTRYIGAAVTQTCTMPASIATTITSGTATIAATNTFAAGDAVGFSATVGTAGGQLLVNTIYYVIATGLSGAGFQVSATIGGTAITPNASGTPLVYTGKFTVTDGTKFIPFMPVVFTAAVGGLVINQVYFVQSVTGNVLVISNNPLGNPVAITSSTANSIKTFGCALLEVMSADTNVNNAGIGNVSALDLEGYSTCKAIFNSLGGSIYINAVTLQPTPTQAAQDIVYRFVGGCSGVVNCAAACNIDQDGTAYGIVQNMLSGFGANSLSFSGKGQAGLTGNGSSGFGLNLAYTIGAQGVSSFKSVHTGNSLDYTLCGLGIAQAYAGIDTASLTLSGNNAGWSTYNGAGTTWTLPTPSVTITGLEIGVICAGTATGNLVVTVPSPGANAVAARTSITVSPGSSISFKVCKTASATYYWAITFIGGVYSAGTVSTV